MVIEHMKQLISALTSPGQKQQKKRKSFQKTVQNVYEF